MEKVERLKVVFFCAWFPNKVNPLAGNFALEHAKCLNNEVKLAVFHVYDDFELQTLFRCENIDVDGLDLYRVSFKRFKSRFLYPLNILLYGLASIKGYLYLKSKFGLADVNHVHVLTRTAILPYFLKLIDKTPYVISEHWGRYLPERNCYHGFLRKWITKVIVNNSYGLFTVSQDLMDAMVDHGLVHKNSSIISNTITDEWFEDYEKTANKVYTFLHVSSLQDSIKNVTGILRAANSLKKLGIKFNLDVIGDDAERQGIENYAKSLLLDDCVKFHGKLYGSDLRKKYRESDAFLLFSNFENQPCVLLEAFASGLPAIATSAGGIPEIVNAKNGILVTPKDEDSLFEAMKDLILKKKQFNSAVIKAEAKLKHSHKAVAEKLLKFYQTALYT